jgi:hypothetical protein
MIQLLNNLVMLPHDLYLLWCDSAPTLNLHLSLTRQMGNYMSLKHMPLTDLTMPIYVNA